MEKPFDRHRENPSSKSSDVVFYGASSPTGAEGEFFEFRDLTREIKVKMSFFLFLFFLSLFFKYVL